MCDPITIGLAFGTSALTQLHAAKEQGDLAAQEAQARSDRLTYEAAVAEQNAGLSEIKAKQARGIAASDALVPEIASKRVVSTARAAAGSSGFTLGKGFVNFEKDIDRRRYKASSRFLSAGATEAYGHDLNTYSLKQTSSNLKHGAHVSQILGKSRRRASIFGGITNVAKTGFGAAQYFGQQ